MDVYNIGVFEIYEGLVISNPELPFYSDKSQIWYTKKHIKTGIWSSFMFKNNDNIVELYATHTSFFKYSDIRTNWLLHGTKLSSNLGDLVICDIDHYRNDAFIISNNLEDGYYYDNGDKWHYACKYKRGNKDGTIIPYGLFSKINRSVEYNCYLNLDNDNLINAIKITHS